MTNSTDESKPKNSASQTTKHNAAYLIDTKGWKDFEADKIPDDLTTRLSQRLLDRNLVVLIGSGASMGVGGPSMGSFWHYASSHDHFTHAIKVTKHDMKIGNVETFLSRCRMAQEFEAKDAKLTQLVNDVQSHIVAKCTDFLTDKTNLDNHSRFLQKLGCRTIDLPRTLVFTTNYDLCLEVAASKVNMPVVDGFSFTFPRRFDGGNFQLDFVRRMPGRTDPLLAEGVFHLYKLHGSVNWKTVGTEVEQDNSKPGSCLIFPRDSKFQLSFQFPFLEMMARFQFAIREPNTTLITIGYGFNDDHLSEPILNALRTNPNFNLVVATRSLQKHSSGSGTDSNRHLSILGDLVLRSGFGNVTLLDCEFSQLVPLFPSVAFASEHDRFKNSLLSAIAQREI